jgi:hypothetical protein
VVPARATRGENGIWQKAAICLLLDYSVDER